MTSKHQADLEPDLTGPCGRKKRPAPLRADAGEKEISMFDFNRGSDLRETIKDAIDSHGGRLGDWSVLSAAKDPYRLDNEGRT